LDRKTRFPDSSQAGERGSILVLVLVCLLALSGLVLLVMDMSFEDAREAGQLVQEYEADFSAEAGLDVALTLLGQDVTPGADTLLEPWAYPFRMRNMAVYIAPCNGSINLNGLQLNNPQTFERTRQAMRAMLIKRNKPVDGIDRLAEWATPASKITGATGGIGSMSDPYARLVPVYHPRRDAMQRPEEIVLVEGWRDVDLDWVRRNFTVWGDAGKVNLNFVPEEVFRAYLPELAEYWGAIDGWRRTKGFENVSQLLAATGLSQDSAAYANALPFLTVVSDYFQIIVEVDNPGMTAWTRYIVKRSALASRDKAKIVCRDVLSVRPLNL
jgi:type II secretory pathway component PulK